MSETATINQIILTSRNQVLDFLKTRPDPDEQITWICSECNAINNDTYHSHPARCGVCEKGYFPAIHLPITGDTKKTLREAFAKDRTTQIVHNIKEAEYKIMELEGEIHEQEEWIRELKEERKKLQIRLGIGEA